MGFDFGQIGAIIGEHMDTDTIDIGRAYEITLPDGSVSVTNPETPLYTDVPCHISFNATDNPDSATVGTDPIIVSLTVNCDVTVDLDNRDLVTARKRAANGDVLETYVGTVGMPATNQSRKTAIMLARQII